MLKAVFTRKANPRIVHFRTRLKSDLARMTLANSITMTPGTITLDLNDDHLTVHWFFCDTNHAKAAGEEVKGRIEKFIGNVWL
jgi:multicomponent Na+:H+ antiporter subunit E